MSKRVSAMKKHNTNDITCKIDNKPPVLPIKILAKSQLLNQTAQDTRLLDLANMELLQQLYRLHITRGKIRTFWKPPKQESNYEARMKEAQLIEKANEYLVQLLKRTKAKVPETKQLAKEWDYNRILVHSSMKYAWKVIPERDIIAPFPSPTALTPFVTGLCLQFRDRRSRVSIEISQEGFGELGRIIAVLYNDYVPKTCENFLSFCKGWKGYNFTGCRVHQIFPEFFFITGDVIYNKGLGGTSIFGKYYDHENYFLRHGRTGVLTMDNTATRSNSSQFLITFRPLTSMDGKYVAFGKVVRGLETIRLIETLGTKTGKPLKTLWISEIKEI